MPPWGVFHGDGATVTITASSNYDTAAAQAWLQIAVKADASGDLAIAEQAFLQALAIDPGLTDAHFGLGVTYFRGQRYAEAASALKAVAEQGAADAVVFMLLGQSLYQIGAFGESAQAFEAAAMSGPLEGESLRRHARARTYADMIVGDIAGALARYPARAGAEVEPTDAVIREGFGLLSAYGHRDAALALGAMLIAANPDDAVQRHLNDAIAKRAIDHVPPDYVEAHFDAFATGFDDKLVGVLGYRVPEQLASLVRSHRPSFDRMLDLGCGTGLAANHLASFGGTLTGVDLSAKMLQQAVQRGRYTALLHAEAVSHLTTHPAAYDLVFAADTLIYFGRLDALMLAVAQALVSGGVFAASVESAEQDFEILPSGRVAHADDYVMRLAEPHFELLERRATDIRLEANMPAKGTLFVWRRR